MSRNKGIAVSTFVLLTAGCATMQHAPESVRSELLVRVWVSTCPPKVACVLSEGGRRYQGALLALEPDSLTLLAWQEPDPAMTLPVGSVDQIQLYRGRRPSAKSAVRRGLLGAVVGAAAGAVGGAVVGAISPFDEAGDLAATGAAVGAVTGLVGGVYSGIFEGDDHWEAVSLRSLRTLHCLSNARADCHRNQDRVATASTL